MGSKSKASKKGRNSPRTLGSRGGLLPAATEVSHTVHPASDVHQDLTVMLMQWGQFIDHDVTLSPISSEEASFQCCADDGTVQDNSNNSECFPILLTPADSNIRFVGNCMEFARSVAATDDDGNQIAPREQVNAITAFLDASQVYGSSEETQRELREATASGTPGHLMRTSDGDLLPQNPEEVCTHQTGHFCFLAGDVRVNEQPGLAAVHTVFVRLHNRLAGELHALRPRDSAEDVFQLTRKIVAAVMQNVHYGEWLPLVMGRDHMRQHQIETGARSDYRSNLDPRISNAFATAAFRFGHSLIPKEFVIGERSVPLRELFNRPDELFRNFTAMLTSLVRPIRTEGAQSMDRFFTDEVTGHLFEPEHLGDAAPSRGLDLVALNIQRGRDHGLPAYNEFREFCGLRSLRSFRSLPPNVSDLFRGIYDSVDDIDLFSGVMAEEAEDRERGLVGPTLACLLGNQFHALKYGDRFYFETRRQPEGFTDAQLDAIRAVTMSHVCCQADANQQIQRNAFLIPGDGNPMVPCSDLRQNFLDLTLFQGA